MPLIKVVQEMKSLFSWALNLGRKRELELMSIRCVPPKHIISVSLDRKIKKGALVYCNECGKKIMERNK
jgi:hypothetical protein